MNEQEQHIADTIYRAMMEMSSRSDRSIQALNKQIGVSDLGFCSERVRRTLDGQEPEDTDLLAAWIGTALGEHVERSIAKAYPEAVLQAEIEVDLQGEDRSYRLTGHPDVILPGMVLDAKSVNGLTVIERTGPSQQQRFQRTLYALGAHKAGLLGDILPEDIMVGNVWVDRSGRDKRLHVDLEPFDMGIVEEAARWLDAVVYAYLNGEEAMKEPPREMCKVACGFFGVCRAYDTDVEGRLTDPGVLAAVDLYTEAGALERQARAMKSDAKAVLEGVEGSTGSYFLRWTHVNEVEVPATKRKAHDRISLVKVKGVTPE